MYYLCMLSVWKPSGQGDLEKAKAGSIAGDKAWLKNEAAFQEVLESTATNKYPSPTAHPTVTTAEAEEAYTLKHLP